MPQTRAELNLIIEEGFRLAIGETQVANIRRLAEFFGKFDELTLSFVQVKGELETIKGQLEGVLPKMESASQASLADLESRASAANAQLTSSISGLEKRDQEISAKLMTTFKEIDAQMETVQLQSATVASIQDRGACRGCEAVT